MDPLIFNIKESDLILSSSCDIELRYLTSVDPVSQEISVTSGGTLFDYKFEIFVRGIKDKFDIPSDRVGRMHSTVKIDVENNIPLKINLNVSAGVMKELTHCHYSNTYPRNITLQFDEDEWNDSWDNLCRFRSVTSQEKNLFFVGYKFEI